MKTTWKSFLKKLIIISLPIILQQLFLNLASLLDTLMVGQLDDHSISGVYIATQIIFVANLMIFGSIEGCGVYFSQFFGNHDEEHTYNCYALKYVFSIIIALIEFLILFIFSNQLVSLFTSNQEEIAIATKYLKIVSYTLIPYAISICISTTLRETHQPLMPMIITFIGIVFNFTFNYFLIYGVWIFPCLKASGAAYGTLINRLVESLLLILYVVISKQKFQQHFFKHFKIESNLFKQILIKSLPLLVNETLWSLSQTILVYFFSQADAIATSVLPIVQTIFNLLFVVLLGLGNGISIEVGNTIGKGDNETAQTRAYLSLLFTTLICIILGIFLFSFSSIIPTFYQGLSSEVQLLASYCIKYSAFYLLINGVNTTIFFLLRSGGKTSIVFLFDSCYGWIVSLPIAFILVKCTSLSFVQLYMIIYSIDIIKTLIGMILIIKKKWLRNLTTSLQ
jgi:putative MATE family efflux protein